MLTDLAAAWINTHYLSLLLLMLAGACFVLAGMLCIFVVRHRDVVLGDDEVPTYVPPATVPIPLRSRHRREDADTHVIPSIPGAAPPEVTKVLAEFLDDVEEATTVLRVIEHEEEAVTAELLQRVRDGLKGPVCPTCGGPFGNCTCYGQSKSGSEKGSEATQVIDLCPLTTLAFEIPAAEPTPVFGALFQAHPHAELTTQNLTAALERAKESVA
jgi:hypothetical protein